MQPLKKLMFGGILSVAVLTAPYVSAHAKLTDSEPKAGTALQGAPKEVMLTFNEKIEPSFSSMLVTDSVGKAVTEVKAKVDASNPTILRLPLVQLKPGIYSVKWAVAGHDGHRRTGSFAFSVK